MTFEEFEKMPEKEQFITFVNETKEAEKDNTPYVGIIDNEIHVVGDPNKTEVKNHDYEVSFAFPNNAEWQKIIRDSGEKIEKETPNFIKVTRKFENVHLTPRRASKVVEAFTRVLTFIRGISTETTNEHGEQILTIRDMTEEEMLDTFATLSDEVEESLYTAVGSFFGFSDMEREAMLLPSALFNAVQIVANNPEVINESDLFFDLS